MPGSEILTKEASKKRQPKPGQKRLTVTLTDEQYKRLADVAVADMREPNNLLSFLLRDQLLDLISDYVGRPTK